MLCGDTRASSWLLPLLHDSQPLPFGSQQLLRPDAQPPQGASTPSRQVVCSCWGVDVQSITTQLQTIPGSDAERLSHLQNTLRCGSNCGSCLPQLRQLVRSTQVATAALSI